MKKILFVAETIDIGGVETSLINWLEQLSKNPQYTIHLVLFRKGIDYNCDNVSIEFLPEFINTKTIPIKNKIRKSKNKFLTIFRIIMDLVISFPIKIKYGYTFGDSIRFFYTNKLEKRSELYDVAVAYTDGIPLDYVQKKINAKKKITFIHRDCSSDNKNKYYNERYNTLNNIVCVSEKSKESFDLIHPNLVNKTIVINNLHNLEKINKLSKEKVLEFNKDYINVLTVGRLCKDKNYLELVKVFSECYPKFIKPTRLYIIGFGDDYFTIKKLIKTLHMDNKIILLGAKKNPYKYMSRCDLYIQSSINEGYCLTVLEAFTLKCPILSTNVGNVSKIIRNRYNGIVIDGVSTEFKQKLVELINNQDMRNSIKNNINISDYNTESIIKIEKILN